MAPHGAALTNILFCNPGATLIELFQEHENMTYAYLSQILGMRYKGIKTMPFQSNGGYKDTEIALEPVRAAIRKHLKRPQP